MARADISKVRRKIHLNPRDFASDRVLLEMSETLIIPPLFSNWSHHSTLLLLTSPASAPWIPRYLHSRELFLQFLPWGQVAPNLFSAWQSFLQCQLDGAMSLIKPF